MKTLNLFILSILFATLCFSQITRSTINEKHNLHFKLLESKTEISKYIDGNADSLGFRPYNGKTIACRLPHENRMITLRAEFSLDNSLKNYDIALVFPPVFYACNIYLNGMLIEKRGNVVNGYTNRIHYTEFYYLSNQLLKFGNTTTNEIAIELLSQYGEHNAVNGLFISSREMASRYTFWRNMLSINFVRGMAISCLFIFLYVIIFYFIRRNKKYAYYLPFAFVCLFYSLSFSNNIANYDFSNNHFLEIITRISFYLWTFFTLYYLLEYTKVIKYKNKLLIILAILSIVSCVFITLQKDVQSVIAFYTTYGAASNFIVDLFLFYVSILFLIRKPSIKSLLLFFNIFLCIVAVLYDAYYFVVLQQKPFFTLIPYSTFLIIVTFFFILAWEQSDVYKLAEQKTNELEHLNHNLENIVVERTAKAVEKEIQFQTIFENSVNAVFLTGHDGKYITINPAYTKITGYPLSFFEHKSTGFITHPDDLPQIKKVLQQLIALQITEYTGEARILNSTGNYIWIELHTSVVLNAHNQFQYVLGTFNEITERKIAEQAIKENEALLKELNSSKDIFMSILAHDLRSPFSAILGFWNC